MLSLKKENAYYEEWVRKSAGELGLWLWSTRKRSDFKQPMFVFISIGLHLLVFGQSKEHAFQDNGGR